MPPVSTPAISDDRLYLVAKHPISSFQLDFPSSPSTYTKQDYDLEIAIFCYAALVIVIVGLLIYSFITRHIRLSRIRLTPGGGGALQSSLETISDIESGLQPGMKTETVPLSPSIRTRIFANALRQPELELSSASQDEMQISNTSSSHLLQVPVPVGAGGGLKRNLSSSSLQPQPSNTSQSPEERWNITRAIDDIVEENDSIPVVVSLRKYTQLSSAAGRSPQVVRAAIAANASPFPKKKHSSGRVSSSSLSENVDSSVGSSVSGITGISHVLPFSFFHSLSSGHASPNVRRSATESGRTSRSARSKFMEGSMFDSEANATSSRKDTRRTKSVYSNAPAAQQKLQSILKWQKP